MLKEDFLRQLQLSLSTELSPTQVQENLRYYEDYIVMQVQGGKSESEVIDNLGNPRLLAKSIIQAAKGRITSEETVDFDENNSEKGDSKLYGKTRRAIGLIAIILVILAVLVVVGILFIQLLPLFIVVGVIVLVSRYFFKQK